MNGPPKLKYLNTSSPGVILFETIRSIRWCSLVGGSMSLRVSLRGIEVLKVHARPSLSFCMCLSLCISFLVSLSLDQDI